MKNLDKHYQKYEHYMRKVNRWPCPEKINFEIWEELKDVTGKVKKAIKDTTVTEEELDSLVWKMMEKNRWK